MPALSVNINKIATLRNARGGNVPNLLQCALDIERFGADGITVHPRPDERHIRYSDVYALKKILTTEFNIEGYPTRDFLDMVLEICPEQVTLVPDPPKAITSNAGWNVVAHKDFLRETIQILKAKKIRTSIFLDPDDAMVSAAAHIGADRIELYTEYYAQHFHQEPAKAIEKYVKAANAADMHQLGINAGHDLSLQNLRYFYQHIPHLMEVSIGHALISDALYLGLENAVNLYKRELRPFA